MKNQKYQKIIIVSAISIILVSSFNWARAAEPTDQEIYDFILESTGGQVNPETITNQNGTLKCPDGRFCLNVPIGNVTDLAKDESLGAYIRLWYGFIIGTVGIVATVVMMIAGLIWLTSAGISGRVGLAKDMMKSGIIGLLIAFFSYTILYIINPNLTVISLPELKTVSISNKQTVNNHWLQQAEEDYHRSGEIAILSDRKEREARNKLEENNVDIDGYSCDTFHARMPGSGFCIDVSLLTSDQINALSQIGVFYGYDERITLEGVYLTDDREVAFDFSTNLIFGDDIQQGVFANGTVQAFSDYDELKPGNRYILSITGTNIQIPLEVDEVINDRIYWNSDIFNWRNNP